MLLNDDERKFLAEYIREATTDPFKGPLTEVLHRRDIYYTDLSELLAAYYREPTLAHHQMNSNKSLPATPCPWPDREAVVRRNYEIRSELQATTKQAI